MLKQKTREEWLKLIPLQTRLQLIEAARKDGREMSHIKCDNKNYTYNLFDAFGSLFTFQYSKQGHNYWYSRLMKLHKNVGK